MYSFQPFYKAQLDQHSTLGCFKAMVHALDYQLIGESEAMRVVTHCLIFLAVQLTTVPGSQAPKQKTYR